MVLIAKIHEIADALPPQFECDRPREIPHDESLVRGPVGVVVNRENT